MSEGDSSMKSYYQDAIIRLDKANKRIAELEAEVQCLDQSAREARSAAYAWENQDESSQARLSEAVKVLEEMVKWLNYLPAPYPDDSQMIIGLTAKAKAFLATLGEDI